MTPLNDRLLYINEDGSRREAVIASAIQVRLSKEDYEGAKSYVESRVDGELQLYYGRKQIREAGDTTVSDMLANKAEEHLRKAREIRGEDAIRHVYNIAIGAPLADETVDVAPFYKIAAE
ncbi:hypothetical protein P7L87_25295 [Vibrio parahaemolyticus]|nr:hypothetical protein [Vibrio parahaemolyticus]